MVRLLCPERSLECTEQRLHFAEVFSISLWVFEKMGFFFFYRIGCNNGRQKIGIDETYSTKFVEVGQPSIVAINSTTR